MILSLFLCLIAQVSSVIDLCDQLLAYQFMQILLKCHFDFHSLFPTSLLDLSRFDTSKETILISFLENHLSNVVEAPKIIVMLEFHCQIYLLTEM